MSLRLGINRLNVEPQNHRYNESAFSNHSIDAGFRGNGCDEDVFVLGDLAINSSGVYLRNSPKTFRLNPKDIVERNIIGRGASSCVKEAIHVPSGTRLALKIINIYDKTKRDQLLKEIHSLYHANCPSVVSFYGAYLKDGNITIALEYMDGGSLDNVIRQVGYIAERALAAMVFQILWALAYLKIENRVHRDIKPSNILINSQGCVKLSDFGISKDLKYSVACCKTFIGTLKYMSPERINNATYSYTSDIWALGIVIYQCATGRYPYETPPSTSYIERVQAVMDNPSPPLPHVVRVPQSSGSSTLKHINFSPNMRDFVAQCVASQEERQPAHRLLNHPWMKQYSINDISAAVSTVEEWIARR
uniref:mitogen-activated protein kinase kinase n=1 Tax=Aplanochytrium stocchinoi TaxID=215587 RepID=A0A7S3LMB3_9STRA|mmetsp:Transcript_7985/g.10433  ORF Transcript_7985/g.10433 Transcript_7985/m.10433 type:complete len:362 (+) Transcript_7985:68-1153(+)